MGSRESVGLTTDWEHKKINFFKTNNICVNFKDDSNLEWKRKSGGRNAEVAFWGQKNK